MVVLMPQQAALRARVPAIADQLLAAALDASPRAVLADLRAAIPDDMFSDYCHLNSRGRREFTRRLAMTLSATVRSVTPSRSAE
jgi:hypothetical protein